jgi:RelE toxin of RelE / RelB toxin-antitoxin system
MDPSRTPSVRQNAGLSPPSSAAGSSSSELPGLAAARAAVTARSSPIAPTVFLFGFAKNQRDNLTSVQLADLKRVGHDLLALTKHQINEAVAAGRLQEVRYGQED